MGRSERMSVDCDGGAMNRIAILCPVRDRVDGLVALIESVGKTSTAATVVVCADDDTAHLYPKNLGAVFHCVPKAPPAKKVNYLAGIEQGYDVYGSLPDDSYITSPGWDRWLLETVAGFPNGIGVVSAKHNGGDAVNFPFVTRRWIDALGWLACPDTTNYMWDTILEMLGDATRIVHAEDQFVVHHENPNSTNIQPFMADAVQFYWWCLGKRKDAIRKLKEASA